MAKLLRKPAALGSTEPVTSLSDFLSKVDTLKTKQEDAGNKADFLFRGQGCDMHLLPHIARPNITHGEETFEKLVLEEFKRTSVPYVQILPSSDWDWLALAQHHGLPTRLLDWTYSALTALWFAVERDCVQPEKGVVWLFQTQADDFIEPSIESSPFTINRTRILRPRVIAERINAQLGVFTCHLRQSDGSFVPLERNKNYRERLLKFTIAPGLFNSIRAQLFACGVNRATLFPGLDGLAAHLKSRYLTRRRNAL